MYNRDPKRKFPFGQLPVRDSDERHMAGRDLSWFDASQRKKYKKDCSPPTSDPGAITNYLLSELPQRVHRHPRAFKKDYSQRIMQEGPLEMAVRQLRDGSGVVDVRGTFTLRFCIRDPELVTQVEDAAVRARQRQEERARPQEMSQPIPRVPCGQPFPMGEAPPCPMCACLHYPECTDHTGREWCQTCNVGGRHAGNGGPLSWYGMCAVCGVAHRREPSHADTGCCCKASDCVMMYSFTPNERLEVMAWLQDLASDE